MATLVTLGWGGSILLLLPTMEGKGHPLRFVLWDLGVWGVEKTRELVAEWGDIITRTRARTNEVQKLVKLVSQKLVNLRLESQKLVLQPPILQSQNPGTSKSTPVIQSQNKRYIYLLTIIITYILCILHLPDDFDFAFGVKAPCWVCGYISTEKQCYCEVKDNPICAGRGGALPWRVVAGGGLC